MILNLTQKMTKLFVFMIAMSCSLAAFAQPANNECSGAMSIAPLFGQGVGMTQTSMTFDNTGATTEASDPATGWECFGEPDGGGSAPSLENTIWFTFTGDGGSYYLRTIECNATNYITDGDTQIALYEGSCGALTPVVCNEDDGDAPAGNYFSSISFTATAGTTYYMMVDGFSFNGAPSIGEFCLEVTEEMGIDCAAAAAGSAEVDAPILCFNETATFTVTDAIVPNASPISGFFWAISSADISGTMNPTMETSILNATSIETEPYGVTLANDGMFPAGSYFLTPITFGAAAVDTAGLLDLSSACVFSANSVAVTVVEDLEDLTVTSSSMGDTGGGTGEASVMVTGGSGAYSYDWGNGMTTNTITNLGGGSYTVTVSDLTGCVPNVVETIVVDNPTGVAELADLSAIQMFPNPAKELTTISYDFTQPLDLTIRVMDILGQTIVVQNEGKVQTGTATLNLNNLTNGIYLVEFTNGEDKYTQKLFVNK